MNGIIQTKIKSCTEDTSSEMVYMGYIWNYKNILWKNPANRDMPPNFRLGRRIVTLCGAGNHDQ